MRRRVAMHFASIGALLFALTRGLGADGAAPIELRSDASAAGAPRTERSAGSEIDGAADEDALYRAALARHLDRDDPVVQARLVQNMRFLAGDASDAAALYRGAVELGLADGDLIVRRRLVERMRLALQQSALADEPGDDVLQAYLDAHGERFATPARVRLVQIFLSRQQRGARLAADAAHLLARLGPGDVARAAALGDALPLPAALPPASARDLARLFGDEFAAAALALAPGRWQGPLPSPYGLHLVWVAARWPATVPALAEVREQIRAAVREERAAAVLRDAVDALRAGAGGAAAGR